MLTYARTKSKAGSKVDGLWTESREMLKSHDGSRCRRTLTSGISKTKTKKRSTGTNLWAVQPLRKSVTFNPWGMYAAGRKRRKKRKKMSQEREDLSAAKLERGRLRGTLAGRCNQARRKGVKREGPVGWGAREGSIIWDLKSSQKEADGQQRAI